MTKPQPPPALAIGGNGPATAAWAVWQAIEVLDRAWMAVQVEPVRGHAADRPAPTDAPLLPSGEALAGVGVEWMPSRRPLSAWHSRP